MKCVIFAVLLIVAVAMVQGEGKCQPWTYKCQAYEECCRHLICHPFNHKCVPKSGLIVPGQDQRPLGDGPYPPNVPRDEILNNQ